MPGVPGAGEGARGGQGPEGSQGHAGSWGAARSQAGVRQLFCCRQPPGQQTSPAGEEASHCCLEKVEQGNCSASIKKKQPNLSFPTQRECYSADVTCNEGMVLFVHSFQHSFPFTCKHPVLLVTFTLAQHRTAPGWRYAGLGGSPLLLSVFSPAQGQEKMVFQLLPKPPVEEPPLWLPAPSSAGVFIDLSWCPAGNAEPPIKQSRIKTSFPVTPRRGPDFP